MTLLVHIRRERPPIVTIVGPMEIPVVSVIMMFAAVIAVHRAMGTADDVLAQILRLRGRCWCSVGVIGVLSVQGAVLAW